MVLSFEIFEKFGPRIFMNFNVTHFQLCTLTHLGTYRRYWTLLDATGRPDGGPLNSWLHSKTFVFTKIGYSAGKPTSYTILEKYSLVCRNYFRVILLRFQKVILSCSPLIFAFFFIAMDLSSIAHIFSYTK